MLIRNLYDPASGIREGKSRIRDKHSGSATLVFMQLCIFEKISTFFVLVVNTLEEIPMQSMWMVSYYKPGSPRMI
jgi:hypothetical protein